MEQVFKYIFNGKSIRTKYDEYGCSEYCLEDICCILGLFPIFDVINAIKEEFYPDIEKTKFNPLPTEKIATPDGVETATFITEWHLYYILLHFNSEKAKPFRQWVIKTVLPTISYLKKKVQNKITPDELEVKMEIASKILNSPKAKELDAYYHKLTGESVLFNGYLTEKSES